MLIEHSHLFNFNHSLVISILAFLAIQIFIVQFSYVTPVGREYQFGTYFYTQYIVTSSFNTPTH